MPLATRPSQTYEVVLSTDAKLPKDKQPIFIFRYVSLVEWEEIAKLSDKFDTSGETITMMGTAIEVIEKTLCGWRNMKMPNGQKVPFNIKRLKSLISMQELTELMQAGISQRPSLQDKKKFDSPSRSRTAKGAKAAKA